MVESRLLIGKVSGVSVSKSDITTKPDLFCMLNILAHAAITSLFLSEACVSTILSALKSPRLDIKNTVVVVALVGSILKTLSAGNITASSGPLVLADPLHVYIKFLILICFKNYCIVISTAVKACAVP
jgi:hypothetical protein